MSTFNARLSFKGEGELVVTLPIVGQISIWAGRDIFLKGATTEIITTLRQYRSMKLEHTLNGEARGCYRVIDVSSIDRIPRNSYRPVAAPRTENISDLKAQMMKANELTKFDEEVLEGENKENEKVPEKTDKENDKNGIENDSNNNSTDVDNNSLEENEDNNNNKTNDEEITELPANIAEITVTVGNLKGKKIGELNAKELRKVQRYTKHETERNAAETALKIKFPQN